MDVEQIGQLSSLLGADLALAVKSLVHVAALPEDRKQAGGRLAGVRQQEPETFLRGGVIRRQGVPEVRRSRARFVIQD